MIDVSRSSPGQNDIFLLLVPSMHARPGLLLLGEENVSNPAHIVRDSGEGNTKCCSPLDLRFLPVVIAPLPSSSHVGAKKRRERKLPFSGDSGCDDALHYTADQKNPSLRGHITRTEGKEAARMCVRVL